MSAGARPRHWCCSAIARSTDAPCRAYRISFIDRTLCFAHASPEERERCQATRREAEQARRARLRRAA